MVIILAEARVLPACRERFLAAANACVVETRKEAGCLAYDFYESQTIPNLFVFNERWEARADLERHSQTDHLKSFGKAPPDCLERPLMVELLDGSKIEKLL